jgi:hypothetical protein
MFLALFLLSSSVPEPDSGALRAHNEERLRHFECFNIVHRIRRQIKSGRSQENVTAEFTNYCDKLEDPRKNICLTLIPSQIPTIVTQLETQSHPDEVCQTLGFSRSSERARAVTKEQCTNIVGLVKSAHESKDSKDTGSADTPTNHSRSSFFGAVGLGRKFGRDPSGRPLVSSLSVCKEFPVDQKLLCHVISRVVSRRMHDELEKGTTADEICTKLDERKLIKILAPGEEAPKQ